MLWPPPVMPQHRPGISMLGSGRSPRPMLPGSQPVEWAGVREAASHAVVPGKGPDLKVVTPRGVRRGYPDRRGGNKAETMVEGWVAQQPYQRLVERVGSTQNGVHQGSTDTSSLPVRENAQWPQNQSRLGIDIRTC